MSSSERVCIECARTFEIHADELERLKAWAAESNGVFALPKRCRDCRAYRRHARSVVTEDTPAGWLTCWDCGSDYYFSAEERDFFLANQWNIPTRCVRCRGRQRKRREIERAAMP